MTAVVGLGGQLVHADEVVRTENPASNLIQAKPADSTEHIIQAKLSGQASGELTFTVSNEELDKVAQVAKHEAVQVITDKEVNLATIKTAVETSVALSKVQTDSDKQVSEVKKVTAGYALRNYGLSPLKSIKFNKARWKEMVKPYFEKNDVFTMPQNENISF
ncbi:hypothetical protein [Streptococcus sp. CL6.35]|nr:hypothetical protein [Streptococcus infantis]